MKQLYPHNRQQVVQTVKNISLLESGDVDIYIPENQKLRFLPSVIMVDIVKVSGTLSPVPSVTIDTGTDADNIVGTTALTSAATGKSVRLVPPATIVSTVTGGKKVRLKKSTLGIGQAITTRVRAGGIAKLTTAAAHGFAVGDRIVVASAGGVGYNGTVTVLAVPSTTTFQYASPSADEASNADVAGRVGNCIVNVTLIGLA